MRLIDQVRAAVADPVRLDARSCCDLLSRLAGLLQVHFAMEDRSLYPAMMASKDSLTVNAASQFKSEMGHLSPAFSQFMDRWRIPDIIEANAGTFVLECQSVLKALRERIEREDHDLYRLADALYAPVSVTG